MKYAKDGADILIDNGWLEQPPQAMFYIVMRMGIIYKGREG